MTVCGLENQDIKRHSGFIPSSSVFLGSLTLEKASCQDMEIFKKPYEEAHMVKS